MELNVSYSDGSVLLLVIYYCFWQKEKKKNPVSDGKFWDHESLLYERDTLDSIWNWIVIPCYHDNININTHRDKK